MFTNEIFESHFFSQLYILSLLQKVISKNAVVHYFLIFFFYFNEDMYSAEQLKK